MIVRALGRRDSAGCRRRLRARAQPNATFTGERVIDVGHRVVRVAFLGRGNTAGDAI